MSPQTISCDCGELVFETHGKPIVTAVCYCLDCQAAGDLICSHFDKARVKDPDGGTAYVTLLETDWQTVKGADKLEGVTLKPNAPTTRFVSTCCHSPMFLKFKYGFWVSTYRNRYKQNPPKIEWRNKVSRRTSNLPFPDEAPRFKGFPLRLFGRLLKARFGL